jgi:hypothetical protein
MVTQMVAPTPNQNVVFSDYEPRNRQTQNNNQSGETAELQPPTMREFAIHILQTIDFL